MIVKEIRIVQIVNRKGLHARASAKLAKLALTLPTPVTLKHEGEKADARSIMDLLCLGAGFGQKVELESEGDGAIDSITAVMKLIEDGFGEIDDATC